MSNEEKNTVDEAPEGFSGAIVSGIAYHDLREQLKKDLREELKKEMREWLLTWIYDGRVVRAIRSVI